MHIKHFHQVGPISQKTAVVQLERVIQNPSRFPGLNGLEFVGVEQHVKQRLAMLYVKRSEPCGSMNLRKGYSGAQYRNQVIQSLLSGRHGGDGRMNCTLPANQVMTTKMISPTPSQHTPFTRQTAMLLCSLCFSLSALSQGPQLEIDLTATDVVSQGRTGTCWSFSTTSFLESEAFRITGKLHDFSEMANVRVIYPEKVERYVRYQGKHQFGPGGLSHDVTHAAAKYGIVPQAVYGGGQDADAYDHAALDGMLEAMAQALVEQSGHIDPVGFVAVEAALDAYLGALPEAFSYQGKNYTPASFRDAMGIDPSAYATLTSFTHHPFGAPFILEVPDNHAQGAFWNVPLDDLEEVVHHALENGYSVAWDADVSNKGFSFRDGWAIMPETAATKEEWGTLDAMPDEPAVDQAIRQAAFDSQENTDDHLMHIVGRATDAQGRAYFIIKNSWGSGNAFGGKQYVSMDYFRHFTMGIMVHSDGLPKELRKEMGR